MLRLSIVAAILLAVAFPASAQTLSYADAIDKLSEACGKDIDRHCRSVQLGKGRILNCLNKNESKLSSTCRSTYPEVYAQVEKRYAAQVNSAKVCRGDYERLCPGVRRVKGHTLNCLLKAQKRVSKKCNQIITDAGFR